MDILVINQYNDIIYQPTIGILHNIAKQGTINMSENICS